MFDDQDTASSEAHKPVTTILVVEDDRAIGSFLVEAIKQETPYQALLATDGYQALKMVHDLKPGLFLINYGIPRMNGLELYDQLHATKELEDVPAVVCSANCPWQEVERRELTRMEKPIELDELLQTIEKVLT